MSELLATLALELLNISFTRKPLRDSTILKLLLSSQYFHQLRVEIQEAKASYRTSGAARSRGLYPEMG